MTHARSGWLIGVMAVALVAGLGLARVQTAGANIPVALSAEVCIYLSDNSLAVPIPGDTTFSTGGDHTGGADYFDPADGTPNNPNCIAKTFPDGTNSVSIKTKYNNTWSAVITQDITQNRVFNFHTVPVTVRLETCGGEPLEHGNVRFGSGTSYGSYYFPDNDPFLETDTSGEIVGEIFPGTYSFQMKYLNNQEGSGTYAAGNHFAAKQITVPDAPTKIVWTTTSVTDAFFSGSPADRVGGPDGTYHNFVSGMELLSGATYVFEFGHDPPGTTEELVIPDCLDYGDAPDSYGTYLASDGARHVRGSQLFLGAAIDGESDGQPTSGATGDDTHDLADEDGVSFTPMTVGSSATVDVTASAAGKLNAWIDFDGNGAFDAQDQIFTNENLSAGVNAGLSFSVPGNAATGKTYARFRFSSESGLEPTGEAPDGEVEDYEVRVNPATGTLEVRKFLFPSYDPGRFDLLIDGSTEASAVGHNGTTGEVEVEAGNRTVGESAVAPAYAHNYRTTIICQDRDTRAFAGYGFSTSLSVYVGADQNIVCTIINQRIQTWFWWWWR